jgi:hypothetical protein
VPGRRRPLVRLVTALLAAAVLVPAAPHGAAPVGAATWPVACHESVRPQARADELMQNRYRLGNHPIVTLPADPRWSENPLHDNNWQYQYQSLRFVNDLLWAWNSTGQTRYRDRALFLLRDWYVSNPRSAPRSPYSWNDHSTAWRAMTYACAARLVPMRTWLHDALVRHGRTLADPDFYVWQGNHALNQSIGLLEVGLVLRRSDWNTLARDRMRRLVVASVDSQGVSNEQALWYQRYNYRQYKLAQERLRAAGLTPGSAFARVDLMPSVLVAGSTSGGLLEMIGDSDRITIPMPGPDDPKPPRVKLYSAGYLFARTGYGASRAAEDETFLSVRFGRGRRFHGHADGAALTLAAWGTRLLVDPGKYTYNPGAWRSFFIGRSAHNVVTVDGLAWHPSAETTRLSHSVTSAYADIRLRTAGYTGVTHTRRITWSRGLDFIVVEDRLSSSSRHTYRQLWHLPETAAPVLSATMARTTRTRGNVLIRQLVGTPTLRVVKGRTSPIQGWISYTATHKVAAPVVIASRTGTNVRYLTLIVPAEGTPQASVSGLRLTAGGYRLTVTIGGRAERISAEGSTISVTPVGG